MQTSKGKGAILARIIGFIGAMLMLTIVAVTPSQADEGHNGAVAYTATAHQPYAAKHGSKEVRHSHKMASSKHYVSKKHDTDQEQYVPVKHYVSPKYVAPPVRYAPPKHYAPPKYVALPKRYTAVKHYAPPKYVAPVKHYAPVRHYAPVKRYGPPVVIAEVYKQHKVKAGETLSGIARQYHLSSWHCVAAVNTDKVKAPKYWVYVGQTIRIPVNCSVPMAYSAPKVYDEPEHYAPRKVYEAPKALVVYSHNAGYGNPQAIARQMLAAYGWSGQWGCLNSLISKESGWNIHAANPTSSAYGLPQAMPGSKMASEGQNWQDSAGTQLSWMMKYVNQRYGSPCGAWAHSVANNWY